MCPLVGVLSCLGIAALPGPALEWPASQLPLQTASVGGYSTQCHSVKIINKCNKMGKKKTGCNFRIRSPYVREFLAETIGEEQDMMKYLAILICPIVMD